MATKTIKAKGCVLSVKFFNPGTLLAENAHGGDGEIALSQAVKKGDKLRFVATSSKTFEDYADFGWMQIYGKDENKSNHKSLSSSGSVGVVGTDHSSIDSFYDRHGYVFTIDKDNITESERFYYLWAFNGGGKDVVNNCTFNVYLVSED